MRRLSSRTISPRPGSRRPRHRPGSPRRSSLCRNRRRSKPSATPSAGLTLLSGMSEGSERDALELALLVARANALIPLKSVSAPETFAALAAAKQLSDRNIGTDLQRISILYGLCASATLTANLNQALAFAQEIIAAAERLDDPAYRVLGYRQLATIQFYTGDNRAALASLQKGRAYRDPAAAAGAELPVRMGSGSCAPVVRSAGAAVARPARQRRAASRRGARRDRRSRPRHDHRIRHILRPGLAAVRAQGTPGPGT